LICRCDSSSELWDDEAIRYATEHLVEVAKLAGGWEKLYRCDKTGLCWVMDWPEGQLQGGGPRRLRKAPERDCNA
jgi:hypothetical protein